MASLFEDLHSSDSEDDDYVPDGEVTSEDDDEPPSVEKDDEIGCKKNSSRNSEILDAGGEKTKIIEETSSTVDQKERANDLFKSFLEEVEAEMKMKEPEVNVPCVSSEEILKTPDSDVKSNKKSSEKLFEFAGETVGVSVENGCVSTSEKSSGSEIEKNTNLESNVPDKSSNHLPIAKPKGLASVLSTIMNKKSKLNTLEKTSLDWIQYKREHGISEELQNFNRGRGGYIEKQRFLERADLRSYEIERDMRMTKRKKNC